MSRHRAFTLIELLISITIIGIVSGAAMIAFGRFGSYTTAKREAERAVRWLYFVMERAENDGRSFSIYIDDDSITVLMKPRGNMQSAGGNKPELLRISDGFSFMSLGGGSARTVYSAQWGTFTPAMTIRVSRTDERIRSQEGDRRQYIILSGQGRIRISDSAPSN